MTPDSPSVALSHCDGEEPGHVEGDHKPADHDENFAGQGSEAEEEDGEAQKGGNEWKDARVARDQRARRRSMGGVFGVASQVAPEECEIGQEERR